MWDAGSSPTRTVASPTWPSSATDAATSSRTFSARVLPSMIVAVTRRGYSLRPMRLSRKNDAEVVETGRAEEEVVVPLAHTEGGLTASVQRGAKAIAESGGVRTYVVADRITRASCFVCNDSGDALALARWIE